MFSITPTTILFTPVPPISPATACDTVGNQCLTKPGHKPQKRYTLLHIRPYSYQQFTAWTSRGAVNGAQRVHVCFQREPEFEPVGWGILREYLRVVDVKKKHQLKNSFRLIRDRCPRISQVGCCLGKVESDLLAEVRYQGLLS